MYLLVPDSKKKAPVRLDPNCCPLAAACGRSMSVAHVQSSMFNFARSVSPGRTIHLPEATFVPQNASSGLAALGMQAEDLGYLYRATIDTPYCEAKYGGAFYGQIWEEPGDHFPELGATFSAPFILWCGLHMSFTWRHESPLLHVISALFSVNGMAAFAAHYLGNRAWHDLDAHSMLLAVWLALGFLTTELLEVVFKRMGLVGDRARCVRDLFTAFAWAFSLWIYWWVASTNMAVGVYELGGRVGALATAAPLICAAFAYCCLGACCATPLKESMGEDSFNSARFRFLIGAYIALLGAIAWVATENMCDRTDQIGTLFKWLPGHFLWHVMMSYGLTQCLLFAGALRADNFHADVTIDTNGRGVLTCGICPCLTSWYFALMPRLVLMPKHDSARVAPVDVDVSGATGGDVALPALPAKPAVAPSPKGRGKAIFGASSDERTAVEEVSGLMESPDGRGHDV